MSSASKSTMGTRWRILALCLVLFAYVSRMVYAQQPSAGLVLYDNFSGKLLDPSKWSTYSACFTNNGLELECVREIENGKLRLAHRTFGNRDTDTGFQFGDANVAFANPSRIKSITTDLAVIRIDESPCLVNPGFGGAAHIDATFFNTGSGSQSDDVGGHLGIGRNSSSPEGEVFVFGQISQGNNYFAYTPLGSVAIGTPVTATLTWDQPNHQFLVSWVNLDTGVKTGATMPYSLSDTTPATNPGKVLTVNTFPANCTASQTSVYIEALFDNVYIGR
jgi:hypothetical protein